MSNLFVNVMLGVRRYIVDFDGEHVYVIAQRNPDLPGKEFLREIPWNGPKAMEARIIARKGIRYHNP